MQKKVIFNLQFYLRGMLVYNNVLLSPKFQSNWGPFREVPSLLIILIKHMYLSSL